MHMKWILSLVAGLLLSVVTSTADDAGATPQAPLRVGVSPVFPPMAFKQGNDLAGVEIDLARALGKNLGREIVFVEIPWEDQINQLNAGKTDIIMSSMSVTMARRHMVSFSEPYFVVGQMALVRQENKNQYILGFPAVPEEKIGALRATTGEFLVRRDFPKTKIRTFRSGDDAAKALMNKRIGLFVSDSTLVWHLAGKYSADNLTVVPVVLSEESLAWAVRKNDEDLLGQVNRFIKQAREDGTLLKAFKRWTAVGN